jgi:SnoaL-like domain
MTNEEKLLELWEDKQVAKVMLRFGRALDLGDWAAYRSCFTEQVNIDFKRLTGQDEVRVSADLWTRFAEQILSPVRRHHVYTNWDISVDGDKAYALVYMTARHWKAAWFVRSGGHWLINRIKHDFQWTSGNNAMFDTTEPELAKTMGQVFTDENKQAALAALA